MLGTLWELIIMQERPAGPETYPLRFFKAVMKGKNPFDPELYKIPNLDEMNKEGIEELKEVIKNLLDEEKDTNKEKTVFTPKLKIENIENLFDTREMDAPEANLDYDFSEYATNNHNYKYRF